VLLFVGLKRADFFGHNVSQYVKIAILRSQLSTLVDCTRYSAARQRYFGVDTLKDVFENVGSRNIIAYVKRYRLLLSYIMLILTSILTLFLIHTLTAFN